MEFNLKKSKIYRAVGFSKLLVFGPLKLWRILFLTVGFFMLGVYFVNYLAAKLPSPSITPVLGISRGLVINTTPLGLAYILLSFGFSLIFLEIFFGIYLKYPQVAGDDQNTAEFLDFDAAMALEEAVKISGLRKEETVSTDSLLLALAGYKPAASAFVRIGLDPAQLAEQLEKSLDLAGPLRALLGRDGGNPSPELVNMLADSNNLRLAHGGERIGLMDLLVSLFDHNSVFKQLAIDRGLDKNDLDSLAAWYESNAEFWRNRKKFWRLENLMRKTPVGIGWTYGYSYLLSHFATDITRRFEEGSLEVKIIGRKTIIDRVGQILARAGENNILLTGEPGVGKRTIILGLAQMIAEGKALPALNYKRVFELNVPLIASSSKDRNEVQNTFIAVLNEAVKAGNIILVIEDFHNFIGALEGMGRVDISEVLLPYLESTGIQILATTDPLNFHKHIEPRADILKVIEKIDVEEPSPAETLQILEELIPTFEARSKIFLTYGAIKNIVDDADRYIKTSPLPEKAIDLLTEVVSRARSQKKSVVFPQDVDETITQKTRIPLGSIGGSEKEKLVNLEAEMHGDIIGQDEAVKVIAQALQRLRAGLSKRGKPAGVFLFTGPTGVGKTLTAKILAKTYFGSPDKMIRFDMSEYQDAESLDRFLGSLRINEPGQLASVVRDNPFSVLLLDEIEKAHKNILNIFLSVFDEGKMTDVFGRKVSFEQNVIIATSNAAADLIRDMVNQGLDPSNQKEKVIDALVSGHYFSPEFLNRFDEIVIFHPLNQEQLYKIAELLIGALVQRLREQGFMFRPTPEITDYISRVGFDPQFGARPMQRAVQDKLESVIARKILEGAVQKGTEFSLTLEEIKT